MEQDILSNLYFGKIVPFEAGIGKAPETVQLRNQLDRDVQQLEKMLDDKGREILNRILDNRAELELQTVCERFKDGFRLGVQLMFAGMSSGNKI